MSFIVSGSDGGFFPSWTTATRPASPAVGQMGYNTTTGLFDQYVSGAWQSVSIGTGAVPQVTAYTSGSGTYTTPTNTKYLFVELVGAGGGGGATAGAGGNGGTTTFGSSLLSATGGSGGSVATGGPGSGGSGSGGDVNIVGGQGGAGPQPVPASYAPGGSGGNSAFGGGAGQSQAASAGTTAGTNTGGGGSGGSGAASAGSAGGGGAGGYCRKLISSPSATYSYAVGAGGTAGSGGTAGGTGAAGLIIVTAYFQDTNMLQNYAIIDGINVINIIQYEEQPSNPPAGFESPIIAVQSDTAGPGWTYVDGVFIAPPVPAPTPEELIAQCKATATGILQTTDWTSIGDVGDPTKANPYLVNQAAFISYRSTVRNLAVNPVVDPVFPTAPTEEWSS